MKAYTYKYTFLTYHARLIMTILLSLVTPAIHGPVISTVYIYTLYLAVDPRSNSNSRGGE